VAVAVEQAPLIVVDEEFRIVDVGPGAEARFGPLLGRILWECFTGSEHLFRPYYERAWRTGRPEEFVQFYNGFVTRVRAARRGDLLALWWHRLHVIDVLTLDDLGASIERTLELLDDEEAEILRQGARASLRLLSGGSE